MVSAPSGAGKTSIVRAALARDPRLTVSVSFTTRRQRPTEENGRDYRFVDVSAFQQMLDRGEFLEHAQVFGHFYGTNAPWVHKQLGAGVDVVLEIDCQGAQQIRRAIPECAAVFILPPSRKALRDRLKARAEDDQEVIDRRLESAISEMSHCSDYDYLIVNDQLDEAVEQFLAIVTAQRLRIESQQVALAPLLRELLSESK